MRRNLEKLSKIKAPRSRRNPKRNKKRKVLRYERKYCRQKLRKKGLLRISKLK
jgi:hypothetical protein